MLIEHTIKRPRGSNHEIGGINYHFAPGKDGAHVCEVGKKEHIDRFLAIPGFRPYKADIVAAEAKPAPAKPAKPVDPVSSWTTKQLTAWAKQHRINPRSKQAITQFADTERLSVPLDDATPYKMLRKIASQYEARKAGTFTNSDAVA